jgi:hypothetical protein
MTTHLVIPDSHAKPGVSNDRFTLAGKFAAVMQPDVIIQLGDWFDMPSLCSYDRGTKGFEGRRYKKDIAAGIEAIDNFTTQIARKSGYKPRLIALGGNHDEGRISKVVSTQAEYEGLLSPDDMKWNDFGWTYVPYKTSIKINGVNYCHALPSGVMGRPIAGANPASTIIREHHKSSTVGHLHLFDYAERTSVDGEKVQALVAGCFFTHNESYAGPHVNKMWWRGLILKHFNSDGTYDMDRWSMTRLKREFG